jgi:UDP-4-amino-4-deoxy-L-arabinose formyltransferase/UDP-glucuronic acid dehydrogenase (UDP-4-keto-hexauronic acid decarboxylating)
MRIAIIGRTEVLYETALQLQRDGHDIGLFVTAKEAPEYTKTSADFRNLAEQWGAPFLHTPRILGTLAQIKTLPPFDIGVSMNYPGVIPQEVIDVFSLGILNAHCGDLPRYRGNAPQAWAILNGEKRVGLCVHKMVGGELDSGDIIAREYFPLGPDTKITAVFDWMKGRIPGLFKEALSQLYHNSGFVLERQSADSSDALRGYPRRPEDGRIDWSQSAEGIRRLVNACNKPYEGAFCEFENKQVIIWDAEVVDDENFLAIPGQVTRIAEHFVDVATGKGKLRIREIEVDGVVHSPGKSIKSLRQRLK